MVLIIKRLPSVAGMISKLCGNGRVSFNAVHTSTQSKSLMKWYQSLWIPRKTQPPYDHVVQIGDPVLRQKSAPVPLDSINSKELNFFIDQLIAVMRNYNLVGISSPQVGIGLKIIVMEVPARIKGEFSSEQCKVQEIETLPLTVMINPELTVTNYNKKTFVEACGSVRGYSAEVPRYEAVTLKGLNRDGKQHELQLKGWSARIAQHEMDHLNGIVYTDIMNRKSFTCTCWHMVNVKRGRLNIPFTAK